METNESSPSQKVSHLLAIIYIYRTLLLANDSWISVINFNFITLQIICTHLLGGCWLMLIIKFSEFISLVCWKTKHFFDNWKISKGEITYNVVLDLAFSVLPCFFFTWVVCPSRFQKFTALRKTCNFSLEITWGQFNTTFTSVIYKCSYCFRVWKQFTLVKVLLKLTPVGLCWMVRKNNNDKHAHVLQNLWRSVPVLSWLVCRVVVEVCELENQLSQNSASYNWAWGYRDCFCYTNVNYYLWAGKLRQIHALGWSHKLLKLICPIGKVPGKSPSKEIIN